MKLRFKIITSTFILFIALLVSLIVFFNAQDNIKKNEGPVIQKALDLYKNEFGSYPHEITDLYPKYLEDKRILKWFEKGNMFYWPSEDKFCFRLGIPVSISDMWVWSCKSRHWKYDG